MTTFFILVGYLLLLVGLGLLSSRFFKGTSADFFVVSRSIAHAVVGTNIYFVPYYEDTVGVFDTATSAFSTITVEDS